MERSHSGRQPETDRPWAEVKYMFYVYILKSKTSKRIYKGTTSDLKVRLKQHNAGKVMSTKAYRPWLLVY
jgi:putative endonuclease